MLNFAYYLYFYIYYFVNGSFFCFLVFIIYDKFFLCPKDYKESFKSILLFMWLVPKLRFLLLFDY